VSALADSNFKSVPVFDIHSATGNNIGQEPKAANQIFSTEWFDLDALFSFDRANDPNCLVGRRWLGRGDSLILQGYTGFGKSSLALQLAMALAMGRPWFGIEPRQALRVLFVQAENNKGDIAEPFQDIAKYVLKLSQEEIEELKTRFRIGRQAAVSGAIKFSLYVRQLIDEFRPDVVFIDPLLSYFGGKISDQERASEFFRDYLQPIQNETGVIFVFVHHLGKPPKGSDQQRQGPDLYDGLGSSDIFNWAREIATLTKHSETTYQLKLGKRGFKAGICDDQGEPTEVLYLKRAEAGKCYWTQSEEIKNSEEAEAIKEQEKYAKLRAFIIEKKMVTLAVLKSRAKLLGFGMNAIPAAADAVVQDSQNSDQRIYSFVRKIAGSTGGTKPKIFSIGPPPPEDAVVTLPKDYPYEDNGKAKGESTRS
jgi:AAA domain